MQTTPLPTTPLPASRAGTTRTRHLGVGLLCLAIASVGAAAVPAADSSLAPFVGAATTTAPSERSAFDRMTATIDDVENGETIVRDFREIVREATRAVFPAVVYIRVVRESHETGRRRTQEASGSGVIITDDGDALTNWHVIDKAIEIRCLLADGRWKVADLVGSDQDLDLAMIRLRLDEGETVPTAEIGVSGTLEEGDFVMAMGAPWGLNRSVSVGIVSCTRRYLPEASEYSLWLQTDAAISPGNSGGPLVDTAGRVIGINTRGSMTGGDMGFAIPADTIVPLLDRLRERGEIGWSWSGILLQPLRDFDRNMIFEGDEGVIVAGVEPSSPAEEAGLRSRDRLLTIAGERVVGMTSEDLPEIRQRLALLPADEATTITAIRGGIERAVTLTPREKGRVEGESLDTPRWGLTVKAINRFEKPDLFFHREEGVFIEGIRFPGNAASAGLSTDDILIEIDGTPVTTIEDVRRVYERTVESIPTRPRILVRMLRAGQQRQVVMDIARDHERR